MGKRQTHLTGGNTHIVQAILMKLDASNLTNELLIHCNI